MTTFDIDAFRNTDSWTDDPSMPLRRENSAVANWTTRGIISNSDGHRGYFKHYSGRHQPQGAFEFIVTELTRMSGIATPPMQLLELDGKHGLVSHFPAEAQGAAFHTWNQMPQWADIDTFFENPNDIRATAILDFWVFNMDRNGLNSIYCHPPGSTSRSWFAIDPAICLTFCPLWPQWETVQSIADFYQQFPMERFDRFITSMSQVEPYLARMESLDDGYISGMFDALSKAGYIESTVSENAVKVVLGRQRMLRPSVHALLA